jgi:hypothetical protein
VSGSLQLVQGGWGGGVGGLDCSHLVGVGRCRRGVGGCVGVWEGCGGVGSGVGGVWVLHGVCTPSGCFGDLPLPPLFYIEFPMDAGLLGVYGFLAKRRCS